MTARTMFTILEESSRKWGDVAALRQPEGNGKYRTYTFGEYEQAVRETACGLRRLGVQKGENIALYSGTRAEFYIADLGIISSGAVAAALYITYPLPDQVKNLQAAGIGTAFAEDAKGMESLRAAAAGALDPIRWILLTGDAAGSDALTLRGLRELGKRAMEEDPGLFDRIRGEIQPEDPAILYLTSGATGEPKMGLASHSALAANADMGPAALGMAHGESTIVFLPSAHIAQRVVMEMATLRLGVTVWFSESLSKLPVEMKTIRPDFFLAPPRVWERIYASIGAEIRKKPKLSQRLFHGALGLGLAASRLKQAGKPVPPHLRAPLHLADRLVFSKIRERLGGRMRIAASGAAPLGKELADFYSAIGMPLIEGYGLTEGGVATLNPLGRPKSGSIGMPLPGVEVKLAEDGELLLKSPCLFAGYYRDDASTAAVLRDGWLYTGDIAEIDADGYIYITGRKKELIVSSSGKKIYPARIEGLFKTEPLINQVVLVGDRLPFVTALFTLNFPNAHSLKGMEAWKDKAEAAIASAGPVMDCIRKTVARVNKQLPPFEQIRKFRVLDRDFTIELGEMTPTMKVRRARVLENFRAVVGEMYMGKEESA